jgi:NADPH2:quinone reductase
MIMRAVSVTRFGGPEVMETIESPDARAAAGQVVIEVEAAEVLFLDTQLRSGWGQEYFALQPPFIPGAGVAGIVSSVGDGADRTLLGRRVIAGTGPVGTYRGGGYADQVAVPETEVFPVPESIEPAVALAALHDGTTALEQLDQAAPVAGERVLITGAAGSLGHWLVPLLAGTGATVIGAARGATKLEHARDLGADEVVDYSVPGWADRVGEVDVVFDGVGGEIGRSAYKIIKPGGRFLGYGAASGEFAAPEQDRGVTVVGLYRPDAAEWRELPGRALKLLEAGALRPTIGGRFALTDAAAAHAAVEARTTRGKTILVR